MQTSYARELYVAAFALMLPRVSGLALADNWTAIAGGPEFGARNNPASPVLTPPGQAVVMIDAAARGAGSSSQITVPGAPALPGGGPAVTGQAFSGSGRATNALLVNLTGSTQYVPFGRNVLKGARYQQVTGRPTAQVTVASPPESGTVSGTRLRLPAYSITLVG